MGCSYSCRETKVWIYCWGMIILRITVKALIAIVCGEAEPPGSYTTDWTGTKRMCHQKSILSRMKKRTKIDSSQQEALPPPPSSYSPTYMVIYNHIHYTCLILHENITLSLLFLSWNKCVHYSLPEKRSCWKRWRGFPEWQTTTDIFTYMWSYKIKQVHQQDVSNGEVSNSMWIYIYMCMHMQT